MGDDTLLPGHDVLKLAGEDRSANLDGSLYPGVVQLHKELRGSGPDCYSVLLTARPPSLCAKLKHKLADIAGDEHHQRMSILPGATLMKAVWNALWIELGDCTELGKTKLVRFGEYMQLFPDMCGNFVFIGDDGQADSDITDKML